jgi:hypothetical protein
MVIFSFIELWQTWAFLKPHRRPRTLLMIDTRLSGSGETSAPSQAPHLHHQENIR